MIPWHNRSKQNLLTCHWEHMDAPTLAENYITRFWPGIISKAVHWGWVLSLYPQHGLPGSSGDASGQHPHVSYISVIFLMAAALKPAHFTIELPSLVLVSFTHKYRLQPMNPLLCFSFLLPPSWGRCLLQPSKIKWVNHGAVFLDKQRHFFFFRHIFKP